MKAICRPQSMRRGLLRRISILALGGLTIGGAMGAFVQHVNAAYYRVAATVCQPEYTSNDHHNYVDDGDWGLENLANSYEYASFICPVIDNTDMPNNSTGKLTSITIQGTDNNGNSGNWTDVVAKVCSWNAGGGNNLDCSDQVSSHDGHSATFQGEFTMTLDLDHAGAAILGTSGETLYLWVDMPVASSASWIRTLYFAN